MGRRLEIGRVDPPRQPPCVDDRELDTSEQLRLIADSVPIHLLHIDRDERFLFVNEAAAKMWNLRVEQFVGKTIADVVGEDAHRELHAYTLRVLQGEVVSYEAPFVTPGGEVRTFLNTYIPERAADGSIRSFVVTGTDITDRKRAEEQHAELLKREHAARVASEHALALVDALLAASPIGLAFIDTDLRYVRINDTLAAINGIPARAHLGRTVREVLGDAADMFEPLLRSVMDSGNPVVNLEFQRPPPSTPGVPRWFTASYFPVRTADGHVLGVGGVVIEITERRAAAEDRERLVAQLDAERRWLGAVLEQLPAGVILAEAPTGKLTFANHRAQEIVGPKVAGAQEIAQYAVEAVFDARGHRLRMAELPLARALFGETVTGEELTVGAAPAVKILRTNAAPVRDREGRVVAAVAAFDDVTEQKHAELEQKFLKDATAAMASSLDFRETMGRVAKLAVPIFADWCIVEVVASGDRTEQLVIEHAHAASDDLLSEMRSRCPSRPAADAPRFVTRVLRTRATEVHEQISDELLSAAASDAGQLEMLRGVGLRSAMIVPMVAHDRTIGAVSFVSAHSGRRYSARSVGVAQELAARAALALTNARLFREAGDALRAREEILAVVSHDLKNPLNAIQMAASLLVAKSSNDPRARKHLEMIQRSASRMDHLIGDLLDLANIQAGRLAVERSRQDADRLILEAFDAHEPAAIEKGLRLARAWNLEDCAVLCDRERILQVFGNLLGNAIKFCRPGDTITVSAEVSEPCVRISVSDTGPGIAAKELPRVFDPYWSAPRHANKGSGLGLYICKGIVEAHDGRLWVESTPGERTTFSFTLPIAATPRA